jgi:FlaA1/EpsC-like NDP-sugar epimerase
VFYRKLNYKYIDFLFFIMLILFLFFLSFLSNFQLYNWQWHFFSTPIGLVDAFFSDESISVLWLEYLKNEPAPSDFSMIQIIIAIFLIFFSFLGLFFKKKLFKEENFLK